ncbi:MAG: response regulator [Balneolales bacterium]|nr:response regulator [Balneolales bacterium]
MSLDDGTIRRYYFNPVIQLQTTPFHFLTMIKILIVEDHVSIRECIRDILQEEGYDVRIAKNGLEAFDVVHQILPDLILCDVIMPEMDGIKLLKELNKDPVTGSIPFVFLTAKTEVMDLREAMNLGADDYLTKPVSREDLLDTIKIRLEKSQAVGKRYEGQFDELRTSLAVSLPHELRTPLTGIMGFSEYLLDNIETNTKEEYKEFLTHIYNSGKRLNRLIENYIAFSELQIQQHNPKMRARLPAKLLSLAEYMIQIADTIAHEHNRPDDLQIQIDDVDIPVTDRDFEKICEELISNAFRFSRKGQKVHITNRIISGAVEITIRDHGIGMDTRQVNLMGGFVQIDRDKNEQQGSGLGFTIAKQLIDLLGGSVKVESKPDFGTSIIFRLPIES